MWVTETGAMSAWQIILTICGKLLMFVMGWLLNRKPAHRGHGSWPRIYGAYRTRVRFHLWWIFEVA